MIAACLLHRQYALHGRRGGIPHMIATFSILMVMETASRQSWFEAMPGKVGAQKGLLNELEWLG